MGRLSREKKTAVLQLAVIDYLTAIIAWFLFWPLRQTLLGNAPFFHEAYRLIAQYDTWIGIAILPSCWLFLYLLSGTYFDVYRKSRLNEINRTLISCLIGCSMIALIAFGNDDYTYFLRSTGYYIIIHTILTLVSRMVFLTITKRRLTRGKIGFRTIIIGGNEKALEAYQHIYHNSRNLGNQFLGFIPIIQNTEHLLAAHLENLGQLDQLEQIIDKHQVEEVIIAIDSDQHKILEQLLTRLSYRAVIVKIPPGLYDIIAGSVKTSNVYDAVFIYISPNLMPNWQRVCKRAIDITVSLVAIAILLPLYIIAIILVKLSSPGPIIYKQERIGRFGKPFHILKFRSMYLNAEQAGPALSKNDDPRITPWGKIMRKWRIDETPQFFNILFGEMSLVGPRPERKYFIDIITQTHPHYKYLHKVKPGLTSWGMVQFGYAENVDEMIRRMRYDLLYIENCSLALDVKILLYTFLVLVEGRGK